MITYVERQVPKIGLVVDVYLSDDNLPLLLALKRKRKTGTIYRVRDGWQYQVNKKHVGEVMPTIADVKKSLEAE